MFLELLRPHSSPIRLSALSFHERLGFVVRVCFNLIIFWLSLAIGCHGCNWVRKLTLGWICVLKQTVEQELSYNDVLRYVLHPHLWLIKKEHHACVHWNHVTRYEREPKMSSTCRFCKMKLKKPWQWVMNLLLRVSVWLAKVDTSAVVQVRFKKMRSHWARGVWYLVPTWR